MHQSVDVWPRLVRWRKGLWQVGDPFNIEVTRGLAPLAPYELEDGSAYLDYSGPCLLGIASEGNPTQPSISLLWLVASFSLQQPLTEHEHTDFLARGHDASLRIQWLTPAHFTLSWRQTANHNIRGQSLIIGVGVERTRKIWEEVGDPRLESAWLGEALAPRLCPGTLRRPNPHTFQLLVGL